MHRCNDNVGCLSVSAHRIGEGLKISAHRIGEGFVVASWRVGEGLKISAGIICSVNKDAYLRVVPNVVWLTSDMLSGEFDIYSNVVWRIDIEQSEDDRDIVSMLFNQNMIGNDTLLLNGEQALEMLHNGQMITNETLLVNTSVIIIKELESSTRMLNKYYLKN